MTIVTSDRIGKNKLLIEFIRVVAIHSNRQTIAELHQHLSWPMKLQKTQPPRKPIIFLSSTYCINRCNLLRTEHIFLSKHVTCSGSNNAKNYGQTSRAFPSKQMRERISLLRSTQQQHLKNPSILINNNKQQQHYSLFNYFVTYFNSHIHNFTLAPYLLSNIIVSNLSRRRDITLVTAI
jgi:hypothetical protein